MVDKGYKQNSGTVMNKQTKVVKLIEKAIIEVEEEIQEHKKGLGRDGNVSQLQKIEEELKVMQNILNPQKYLPGYARAIVDSWDLDSELGGKLLEVANKYKQL